MTYSIASCLESREKVKVLTYIQYANAQKKIVIKPVFNNGTFTMLM